MEFESIIPLVSENEELQYIFLHALHDAGSIEQALKQLSAGTKLQRKVAGKLSRKVDRIVLRMKAGIEKKLATCESCIHVVASARTFPTATQESSIG